VLATSPTTAWIEDPVGPSMFDEEGKGHHGSEGPRPFLGHHDRHHRALRVRDHDSFACANECVNVGVIHTTLPNGYRASTEASSTTR